MAEVVACKICGKTFSRKKNAEEHEKQILSNIVATIPSNLLNRNILSGCYSPRLSKSSAVIIVDYAFVSLFN